MKLQTFVLSVSLLGATLSISQLPVAAQAPTGKRAVSRQEVHLYQWPRFARTDTVSDAEEPMRYGQVLALQYLLRNRGFFSTEPDGDFGAGTERAVKRFQKAKHIVVDGVVGEQTFVPLLVRLRNGDRGHAVRALQLLLAAANGDYGTVKSDGIFATQTESAVRDFQKRSGIYVDGMAGPQTWWALFTTRFAE